MKAISEYLTSTDRTYVPELKQALYFSRQDKWFILENELIKLRLPHITQIRGISICGLGQVDQQKTTLPAHIEDELKYFLSQQLFDYRCMGIHQDSPHNRNNL